MDHGLVGSGAGTIIGVLIEQNLEEFKNAWSVLYIKLSITFEKFNQRIPV